MMRFSLSSLVAVAFASVFACCVPSAALAQNAAQQAEIARQNAYQQQQFQRQQLEGQLMQDQLKRRQEAPPAAPAPNYIPRFGALAISEDGMVYALLTSREGGMFSSMPQSAAIEACQKVRPGKSTCKVVKSFTNTCLALAWSSNTRQAFWAWVDSYIEAEKSALADCNKQAGGCFPVVWTCAAAGDGSEPVVHSGFMGAALMNQRMLAVDKRLKVLFISPKTEKPEEARVLVEAGAYPIALMPDASDADLNFVIDNPGTPKTLFYGFSNACVGVSVPNKGVTSEKDFFIAHAPVLGDARIAAQKACNRVHGKAACGYFKLEHEKVCVGKYDYDPYNP